MQQAQTLQCVAQIHYSMSDEMMILFELNCWRLVFYWSGINNEWIILNTLN